MRLLVVFAHPDDESFGCGSVLARASAAGHDTALLCATRGETGESRVQTDDLATVGPSCVRPPKFSASASCSSSTTATPV